MSDAMSFDSVILPSLIGPVLFGLGYYLRMRRENKRNRRLALYELMEIWHRISAVFSQDYDSVFDTIVLSVQKRFPGMILASKDIEELKSKAAPILRNSIQGAALADLVDCEASYRDAIKLMAGDDPVFAYEISSASKIHHIRRAVDTYLDGCLKGISNEGEQQAKIADTLKGHATGYVEADSLKGLERDIKKLAFRVSVFTYVDCQLAIRRRKNSLAASQDEQFERLIDNVINTILGGFRGGEARKPRGESSPNTSRQELNPHPT